MRLTLLLTMLLLGQSEKPRVEALVERWLTTTGAERADAADALEAMGPAALPALYERLEAQDPEARQRVGEMIDQIGARRLLRATLLTVNFDDQPLDEVVSNIEKQTGLGAGFFPKTETRWHTQKLTWHEPQPIPFWDAIDRLGQRADVRVDPQPTPPGRGPTALHLVARQGPPAPSSHAGPYHVLVADILRHRQTWQVPEGRPAVIDEQFTIGLIAQAEPGIIIEPNGLVQAIEAVDDEGRDLLAPLHGPVPIPNQPNLRQWHGAAPSALESRLTLKLPEAKGKKIARLRGYLPVIAFARIGERLSIPLEGSLHKTFSGAGVTITVERMNLTGNVGRSVQLTVRDRLSTALADSQPGAPARFAAGPRQMTLGPAHFDAQPSDHLAVVDEQGHELSSAANLNGVARADGSQIVQLHVLDRPDAKPSRLRYLGVAVVATELPFEFTDLPIP